MVHKKEMLELAVMAVFVVFCAANLGNHFSEWLAMNIDSSSPDSPFATMPQTGIIGNTVAAMPTNTFSTIGSSPNCINIVFHDANSTVFYTLTIFSGQHTSNETVLITGRQFSQGGWHQITPSLQQFMDKKPTLIFDHAWTD